MTDPLKTTASILPAIAASALGILVMRGEWFVQSLGFDFQIQRTGSMVTVEYFWGMFAVFLLGYVFYKWPAWCAIWFMLGHVIVTHSIYFLRHGVPNLWPLELAVLAVLTLPYIGLAWLAAYLRKRFVIGRRSG